MTSPTNSEILGWLDQTSHASLGESKRLIHRASHFPVIGHPPFMCCSPFDLSPGSLRCTATKKPRQERALCRYTQGSWWLWVKHRFPKWNPGNWENLVVPRPTHPCGNPGECRACRSSNGHLAHLSHGGTASSHGSKPQLAPSEHPNPHQGALTPRWYHWF